MKAANYAFQGAYLFDPDQLRNPSIQPGKKPAERDSLIIDPGVHTIASGQKGPVVMKGDVFTGIRSEEHTSELQSLMRISYAVFCLKNKTTNHIVRERKYA